MKKNILILGCAMIAPLAFAQTSTTTTEQTTTTTAPATTTTESTTYETGTVTTYEPGKTVIVRGPQGPVSFALNTAANIVDVLPTLLALAGMPVPAGLDGRPVAAALERTPSLVDEVVVEDETPRARPYDAVESAAVAARLVALGYVEP